MNGLVLSGGAARGFAHAGVFKTIEEKNIDFQIITGTSMGALIGALIADGKNYDEIYEIISNIPWLLLVSPPGKGSVMTGESIEKYLHKIFGNKQFKDLKKKFACIATDIDSGEEIVFTKGKLVPALRATISIPGIF